MYPVTDKYILKISIVDECTALQTECYLPGYDIQGPTTPGIE